MNNYNTLQSESEHMSSYSQADRDTIFAGRSEIYRVNIMVHRYGDRYDRTETRWFKTHGEARDFAADAGCTEDVNMGAEWFADQAFANHNASRVCLLVRSARISCYRYKSPACLGNVTYMKIEVPPRLCTARRIGYSVRIGSHHGGQ